MTISGIGAISLIGTLSYQASEPYLALELYRIRHPSHILLWNFIVSSIGALSLTYLDKVKFIC
jgi:hypothetical protein